MEQAGLDASEAFDQIGHSDDAVELLKGMLVGPLMTSKEDEPVKQSVVVEQEKKEEQPQGLVSQIFQFGMSTVQGVMGMLKK